MPDSIELATTKLDSLWGPESRAAQHKPSLLVYKRVPVYNTPPSTHVQVFHNVLQYVPVDLQQLHKYLEVEFNPLLLCKRVAPIFEGMESDDVLKEYIEPLKEITLVRLIKEVKFLRCCVVSMYSGFHFFFFNRKDHPFPGFHVFNPQRMCRRVTVLVLCVCVCVCVCVC